ncbi:restriction endonuclease subunit S [Polynucleobacter sphagniphilus]|uniref:restriction endonuclease subunit S n=1 Tax=Polynucleobacter sphagniphilus TaxID=1743169 RepID=UPI00247431FA|nr:restriction endonuclease subunit S [Polynucleobacter sphagniphilus]MDH6524423.1 type I restriction enzyme S subunit [Polynucleobacter sphagniphilus]
MSSKLHTLKLVNCTTKIGSGATPTGGKSAYLETGSFALIRSQNILNEGFSRNGLAFIDEIQADKLNNVEVLTGDVLLNITGDSVARVCLVPDGVLPARVNQHVAIIRPDPKYLDNRFLKYYLLSEKQQNLMLSYAAVGATRNALTKGMIEQFEILCPSIAEQIKIANHLSDIDKRIDLLKETNKTLESIAQAIFKSWFVDFDPVHAKQQGIECAGIDKTTADLFPNSFVESELGLIPKGWKVGKVNELGEVICGKTPSTSDKENFDGNIPFITIPDMHNNIAITSTNRYLSKKGADSQHKKYLRKGSVCISCIATPGLVSKVTVDSQSNQQINSVIPDSKWGDDFVLFLLRRIGDAVKMAGSGGSIFHNLNTSNFREIKIILPSSQISNVFNELASVYMEKIISNQYQIKTLIALRDTLLPRLISGKLDLSNIEEELEGVA